MTGIQAVSFLWMNGWIAAFAQGCLITVLIAGLALAPGLLIGMIFALVKWAKLPIFSFFIDIYITVIRSIPELLVIYFFFFASENFLKTIATLFGYYGFVADFFPFLAVICAIATIVSAYATETLRGALSAIPSQQIEAARALGLSGPFLFWYILLPQMIPIALPGLNNIWQNTIKDTALVSLVAVSDLLYRATIGANSTGHPFLFYGLALVFYLMITMISQLVFTLLEKKFYYLQKSLSSINNV